MASATSPCTPTHTLPARLSLVARIPQSTPHLCCGGGAFSAHQMDLPHLTCSSQASDAEPQTDRPVVQGEGGCGKPPEAVGTAAGHAGFELTARIKHRLPTFGSERHNYPNFVCRPMPQARGVHCGRYGARSGLRSLPTTCCVTPRTGVFGCLF